MCSAKNRFGAFESRFFSAAAFSRLYEVSSIEVNSSGSDDSHGEFGPHLKATNYTLKSLILLSYRIPEAQLIGGPDWIGTLRFDLEAKAAEGVQNLDPEQILSLLRSLLEDRFQLKAHRETTEGAVFNLIVGKNGSKLKETVENGAPRSGGGVRCGPDAAEMTGTANSIEDLIRRLAAQVGRPVIDKTNLTGKFDFKMTFNPRPLVSADSSIQSAAPDIFTALQEQLGLKLESARGPVEVLVIDHAEKPDAN